MPLSCKHWLFKGAVCQVNLLHWGFLVLHTLSSDPLTNTPFEDLKDLPKTAFQGRVTALWTLSVETLAVQLECRNKHLAPVPIGFIFWNKKLSLSNKISCFLNKKIIQNHHHGSLTLHSILFLTSSSIISYRRTVLQGVKYETWWFKRWNLSPYHPCQEPCRAIQPLSTLRHLMQMELYPTQRAHNWAKPGLDQAAYLGNHQSLRFGLICRGCWRSRESNGLSRTSWASCDSFILLLQSWVCCH